MELKAKREPDMIVDAAINIADLTSAWQRAITGDPHERAAWQTVEGSGWSWRRGGPHASRGSEWAALAWRRCGSATLHHLNSFRIEATVSGTAALAGLSLGPYKDFLIEMTAPTPRRLRLEVYGTPGIWAFYVDDILQTRSWWDSHIQSVADLLDGELCFKTYNAEQVTFSNLSITECPATCQLSVIMTCNRFTQRMRVVLRSWLAQDLALGSFELLVANPASADGCHELLAAAARSYPHIAVREIAVDPQFATNKGAMINQAVAASRGRWVWLTDADCLFEPGSVTRVLDHLRGARTGLFFGQRHHLSPAQTDALLCGRLDGLRDFDSLLARAEQSWVDCAPWGYTQIVPRVTLERWPYSESINHFAHSDAMFADLCRRRGLRPTQIPGLRCLHLVHPFAWYGTAEFL